MARIRGSSPIKTRQSDRGRTPQTKNLGRHPRADHLKPTAKLLHIDKYAGQGRPHRHTSTKREYRMIEIVPCLKMLNQWLFLSEVSSELRCGLLRLLS